MTTPSDVFAPCAKARVIDEAAALQIQTSVVVGAANDTPANNHVATELARRGVLYTPDFVANAGGVIHIHALRSKWTRSQLDSAIAATGDRVRELLDSNAPGSDLLTATQLHADQLRSAAFAA